MEVTRAAYYQFASVNRKPVKPLQATIIRNIQEIREQKHFDAYGSPRMHRELIKRGIQCCRNTVAKCMRSVGIAANRRTKFRISTTNSNHNEPIAPNRLNQNFTTEKLNQVWLTDMTYIATKEDFTYLCAFVDLHSRKIVSWATSRHIDSELVIRALDQAIVLRSPSPGLIVHSDRGSQYASESFRSRLAKHRLIQSMSRRGNCYDNAPMESLFKSYKTEEVQDIVYESHEHATRSASGYIESFYNSRRLHSSLGYCSPIDFEQTQRAANSAVEACSSSLNLFPFLKTGLVSTFCGQFQ